MSKDDAMMLRACELPAGALELVHGGRFGFGRARVRVNVDERNYGIRDVAIEGDNNIITTITGNGNVFAGRDVNFFDGQGG